MNQWQKKMIDEARAAGKIPDPSPFITLEEVNSKKIPTLNELLKNGF